MKTMKLRLPVIVTCDEDGCYLAEVPVIRGFTQGNSREEALAKVRDVVRLCLVQAADECDTIHTDYHMEQVDVTIWSTGVIRTDKDAEEKRIAEVMECWYNEHCT